MRERRGGGPITWLLLVLLAASVGSVGRATAQGVVSQVERDHLNRIDRDQWPGELYLDEFQPMLRRLTTSPEGTAAQRALLCFDFLGVAPKRRPAATRVREGGLRVERFLYEDAEPMGPDAFLGQMARYVEEFETIGQREIHVRRVEVLKGKGDAARPLVDVDFETFLLGAAGGLRRSDRATWRATVERQADSTWQARSLNLVTLEVARSERVFTDVTSLLPDSYRTTDPKTNKYTDFPANNGITLADWDGDGDLDIHLFRPYLPGLFYENDGAGRFREGTPPGLEQKGDRIESMSGTAYFFDADNDGDLDFIRLQNRSAVRFYKNDAGRFVEASREAGFSRLPGDWWIGAAFADYDRDGWIDLYLLRYADRDGRASYFDSPGHQSFLLRNTGDGRFSVVTEESGMNAGNKRISWAAAWGDYNSDGYPDLYVANDFGANSLYTNHRDGTFSEDAKRRGVDDRGNGMGVSWADYDNDGVLDLYVSNMHSFAGERITRSLGDPLTPAQASLARRFSKGNSLFKVRPDGTFQEVTPRVAVAEAGWAWGHLFFDYDNDGDQDLYVVNGYFSNIKNTDT